MTLIHLYRKYKAWNPVHPTAGAFWGFGVGLGCGVGWGPGFGPECIGYVGSGCGVGFSVGVTFIGFGIGLPAAGIVELPWKCEHCQPLLRCLLNRRFLRRLTNRLLRCLLNNAQPASQPVSALLILMVPNKLCNGIHSDACCQQQVAASTRSVTGREGFTVVSSKHSWLSLYI